MASARPNSRFGCHPPRVYTDDPRDAIADAVSNLMPTDQPALLSGWVLVYEWASMDGKRWLHVVTGAGAQSGHYVTDWQISGYLHEAMHGEWQRVEEE